MTYYSHADGRPQNAPVRTILRILNEFDQKTFEAKVHAWMTVAELKQKLEKDLGIPVTQQRLFIKTQELTLNNMTLISYGVKKRCSLTLRAPPMLKNTIGSVKLYETIPKNSIVTQLVANVQEGFNTGLVPKLTMEGTSGSYILRLPNASRSPIAIFKPFDEEPFAPNNPKGYTGKLGSQGFRKGVLSGEAAAREVAAYLTDSTGFLGVPPTTFVEIVHPYFANRELTQDDIDSEFQSMIPTGVTIHNSLIKHGSIQSYIENAEEASDYSYSQFPEEDVRKIAILDILMLNCDRNEGNILVKKEGKKFKLIPIDHGLCLPDAIDICTYEVVWTDWPHIHKPFTEDEINFISTLKPKEDAQRLGKHLKFRDICLRNSRIASTVLTRSAKAGMTIGDIATLLYKDDPDLRAPIEDLIRKTDAITNMMKNAISPEFLQNLHMAKRSQKFSKSKILLAMSKSNADAFKSLPDVSDAELLESLGLGDIPLGGRSHSDNPILRYTMNNLKDVEEDLFDEEQQFEHLLSLKLPSNRDQPSTNDSISEEDEDAEETEITHTPKPEAKKLVRKASMPDLNQLKHMESEHEDSENGLEKAKGLKNGKKDLILSKRASKLTKNESTPAHLDELFFYYFEEFLDHKIETIMKNKIKTKGRGRFMSFDNF